MLSLSTNHSCLLFVNNLFKGLSQAAALENWDGYVNAAKRRLLAQLPVRQWSSPARWSQAHQLGWSSLRFSIGPVNLLPSNMIIMFSCIVTCPCFCLPPSRESKMCWRLDIPFDLHASTWISWMLRLHARPDWPTSELHFVEALEVAVGLGAVGAGHVTARWNPSPWGDGNSWRVSAGSVRGDCGAESEMNEDGLIGLDSPACTCKICAKKRFCAWPWSKATINTQN